MRGCAGSHANERTDELASQTSQRVGREAKGWRGRPWSAEPREEPRHAKTHSAPGRCGMASTRCVCRPPHETPAELGDGCVGLMGAGVA